MGSYVQDERLHDLVAVGHVRDHVRHVVLRRPDQRGTKHQSQVPGFHLDSRHSTQQLLLLNPTQGPDPLIDDTHGGLKAELRARSSRFKT